MPCTPFSPSGRPHRMGQEGPPRGGIRKPSAPRKPPMANPKYRESMPKPARGDGGGDRESGYDGSHSIARRDEARRETAPVREPSHHQSDHADIHDPVPSPPSMSQDANRVNATIVMCSVRCDLGMFRVLENSNSSATKLITTAATIRKTPVHSPPAGVRRRRPWHTLSSSPKRPCSCACERPAPRVNKRGTAPVNTAATKRVAGI